MAIIDELGLEIHGITCAEKRKGAARKKLATQLAEWCRFVEFGISVHEKTQPATSK
jgi:hypothetical protein